MTNKATNEPQINLLSSLLIGYFKLFYYILKQEMDFPEKVDLVDKIYLNLEAGWRVGAALIGYKKLLITSTRFALASSRHSRE